MDLVTLNHYQFASFGQFPSKLRFYHQNLPGYLDISNVVSFWDTLEYFQIMRERSYNKGGEALFDDVNKKKFFEHLQKWAGSPNVKACFPKHC